MKGTFEFKHNERKSFTIKQGDNSIEVGYDALTKAEKAAILAEKDFSHTPVTATGVLKRYADAQNTYYIEGQKVTIETDQDTTTQKPPGRPEPTSGAETGISLREVQLNQEKYIGKQITVEGAISLSTYFNYGYSDIGSNTRQTHYAFRLEANGVEAYLYWKKSEAQPLKDALLNAESGRDRRLTAKVTFVILKERYERTDDIYAEILRADLVVPAAASGQYAPFFTAAKAGDFETARGCLYPGFNINITDTSGKTALMLAAEAGNTAITRTLLANGADPNFKDAAGHTALDLAVANRHTKDVDLLKTAATLRAKTGGSTVNLREIQLNQEKYLDKEITAEGRISLSTYFNYGYSDVTSNTRQTHYSFRLLDSNGVEANLYWRKSEAQALKDALVKAESSGDAKLPVRVTFVIRKDRYERNEDIYAEVVKVWQVAGQGRPEDEQESALRRNFDLEGQLVTACAEGNRQLAQDAIARGALVDARSSDGTTPLMLAAANGNAQIIGDLVAAHAGVNRVSTMEELTPLMYAAANGKAEAVKQLITARAAVNAATPGGDTALHLAAMKGHLDVAKTLVEAKANIDLPGQQQNTPLMLAVQEEKQVLAELLLAHGARLALTNRFGKTALHMAAFHKNTGLAKLLVQKDAPLNLQDEDLNTPLIIAAHQGNKETVALLLQAGADPTLKDKWGTAVCDDFRLREQSPEIAAMIQSAAKAKAPADAGSSQDDKSKSATTPRTQSGVDRLNEILAEARKDESVADQRVKNVMLQNAARLGKVENVARYLKEGADINTLDPVGNTPLMLAAQRGHPETVKFLIEKGADLSKTNRFGKMAIHLAKDPDVISVLKSAAGTK
jgi:ankyrin repeat protein